MRAQTYRPRIQNGPVTKRRGGGGASKVAAKSRSSRSRRSRKKTRQEGSNVLLMLMITGAIVAAGFVFALRSQINAHHISQAEAQLREELDEIANQQRYEILQQQRALSPRESDRKAREAGLVQPKLNQPAVKLIRMPKVKKGAGNQRQLARSANRR